MDLGPLLWVIIDDTSSGIRYLDGRWVSDVGNRDLVGSNGMPYLRTLHGTNSSASFEVDFTGSAVAVIGSNMGSRNKYWNCSVDGVATNYVNTSDPMWASPCNNYALCYATDLDDRNHTLTVNATPSGNQTFWLDRIEYAPSPQAPLEQKAIRVMPSALAGSRTKTFTFYGVSVSWYGRISSPSDPSDSMFNLSWSVDQADANYTWDRNGNSNASYPLQNQKFFETPTYPFGKHTLRVMDTVGFQYLIVQNGTVPTKSTSESHSGTIGPTVATSGSGMSRAMESGVIAGGVLGGVLIFGITFFVFFCRRRLKSQKRTRVYWDELFFDQKPAHSSLSPLSYPVQRKPRTFPIYSPNTTPADPSRMESTNESSLTTESISHTRTHEWEPQPIPPSVQQGVTVDVGQGSTQPVSRRLTVITQSNSGVRPNGQTLETSVIHLPPEYTPN